MAVPLSSLRTVALERGKTAKPAGRSYPEGAWCRWQSLVEPHSRPHGLLLSCFLVNLMGATIGSRPLLSLCASDYVPICSVGHETTVAITALYIIRYLLCLHLNGGILHRPLAVSFPTFG